MLLNGREQRELTEYLGLKNVAFSEWKSGKSKSYRKYLIEIADFFNVSLDYLVYGTEKNLEISDTEKHLFEILRVLSDYEQGLVIGKAETLAELAAERAAEQAKKAAKSAELAADEEPISDETDLQEPFYVDICSLPMSAGTGIYLDDDSTEPLQIERTHIAEAANYAIRVSGNSMEPAFSDGDIVLVETCPNVEIGEIGIFIVNGEGFIKKLGTNRLISLNPEYDDVPFHDEDAIYCRGRVLGKATVVK